MSCHRHSQDIVPGHHADHHSCVFITGSLQGDQIVKHAINKNEIEFRTLHDDEFDQVAEVFSKSFGFNVSGDKFRARFKGGSVHLERQFVAVHRGMVVGGIRADFKPLYFKNEHSGVQERHECGEINDVSTLPRYRRLGISRKLMSMAIEYMNARGWELCLLQANPKYFARDLYESVGFRTLKSTGELYHVSLGSFKARWSYFNMLALILPLLLPLAKIFAPQPPRHCIDIPKLQVDERAGTPEGTGTKQDAIGAIGAIEIKGSIERSHPWTGAWVQGMRAHLEGIQGLHDELKSRLLLDQGLNEEIPRDIIEKSKNNALLNAFMKRGGKRTNFILFYRTGGENGLEQPATRREMESASVGTLDLDFIGGAKYRVDFFQKGGLKVFVTFIDAFWLEKARDDPATRKQCLLLARRIIGKYFPVIICRAGTGNLPLRDALISAGLKPVAGGITMVMPIKNKKLFERLERNIEPWVLF